MKKSRLSLAWQNCIGMILGIIVGAIFYGNSIVEDILQPVGDIFINLIKVIILPIIISTLVTGIAGLGDAKKFGKIGGKTILYFEIITTIALTIGLIAANIVQPGSGIDMDQLSEGDVSRIAETAEGKEEQGMDEGICGMGRRTERERGEIDV